MDNIVGSQNRISKHWTNAWLARKQNLSLNKKQTSLIIGSLLGDGTMRKDRFSISGNYFRDRDKGYRIYFGISETKKLIEIIKPFVIKSMRYKIGYST